MWLVATTADGAGLEEGHARVSNRAQGLSLIIMTSTY